MLRQSIAVCPAPALPAVIQPVALNRNPPPRA